MAIELAIAGKSELGLVGLLPARVPADVKLAVLSTVDAAVDAGFDHTWACSLWGVADDRVHRWRARLRLFGSLVDLAPGGHALHGVTPAEVAAILAIAEAWGTLDGSHRKLADRGSYTNTVWVSPSTFLRVLTENGLILPEKPPRTPSVRKPWPAWLVWAPNRFWIWDVTHFTAAGRAVVRDRGHGVTQMDPPPHKC